MYNYSGQLAFAKNNNKVYRGIRYYTFGETYLCVENDKDMQYPFDRICDKVSDKEIKKYIDTILKETVPIEKVKRMIDRDIETTQYEINDRQLIISDLKILKDNL